MRTVPFEMMASSNANDNLIIIKSFRFQFDLTEKASNNHNVIVVVVNAKRKVHNLCYLGDSIIVNCYWSLCNKQAVKFFCIISINHS